MHYPDYDRPLLIMNGPSGFSMGERTDFQPFVLAFDRAHAEGYYLAQIPFALSLSKGRKNQGMSFWVYILRCTDNSYYTGHTDNLERRVVEHQTSEIEGYASTRSLSDLSFSFS